MDRDDNIPTLTRGRLVLCLATILVMALSLGPSFAHLLEAGPRLTIWSPELWREATVFNSQFMWFAIVGGPIDIGAVVLGAILAFVLRREKVPFRWALAAAILFAASLAVWLSVVAPANAVLATWAPGPVPENFEAVRDRWESGHVAMTAIKFCGLTAAVLAGLTAGRTRRAAP
jgi:hypothetical protein